VYVEWVWNVTRAQVEALEREIALLRQMQHPNIVQYYGTARKDDKLYIFLEFCSGGSVASALSRWVVSPSSAICVVQYVRHCGAVRADLGHSPRRSCGGTHARCCRAWTTCMPTASSIETSR
jgi:hypothetical protein